MDGRGLPNLHRVVSAFRAVGPHGTFRRERLHHAQFVGDGGPIETPYGTLTVTPEFRYQTNANIIHAPDAGSFRNTRLPFFADRASDATVHDLYGRVPGTQFESDFSGLEPVQRDANPNNHLWAPTDANS